MQYIIISIIVVFIIFIWRLFVIRKGINKLELNIRRTFNSRTNMIPAIFESTKNIFSKHEEIFEEVLRQRKKELYKFYIQKNIDNLDNDFVELLHIEKLIHHELNFIFKVSERHQKLSKKWNFIYLKNLIVEKSYDIAGLMEEYKSKIGLYNKLIDIKNATIIWMIIPLDRKIVI